MRLKHYYSVFAGSNKSSAAVALEIPMGIPIGIVWNVYRDCNQSPWAYGDFMGIFELV